MDQPVGRKRRVFPISGVNGKIEYVNANLKKVSKDVSSTVRSSEVPASAAPPLAVPVAAQLPVPAPVAVAVPDPLSVPAASVKEDPCPQLFDPCTREPIQDLKALEKRINELRLISTDNPEIKKFPLEIATRLDLLIDLLNRKEPPSNKLFIYTINGQLYEAYWDIVFTLNLQNEFERTEDFYMINKKAELIHASESQIYIKDPIEYLKGRNVNEGASGASDITFCYKKSNKKISQDECSAPSLTSETCSLNTKEPDNIKTKFYFCSSKFYKNDDAKNAESFDIQKIYTAVKKLHQDFDVNIILLVKDKNAVNEKLKRARNKYISEEASKVYGEKDLYAALLKLYNLANQKIKGEITEISLKEVLGITDKIKPILSPRLHQHIAILKIQKAIEKFKTNKGISNKFLVGILPRGGKTYIAGGIVSILQPKRVVVLLGAKSETISQFTNDLFKYYQDFVDYNIVDVKDEVVTYTIDPSKKYIFVMSVELYKMENNTRKILKELKSGVNHADLFICDEAHLKQTTSKAIKELEEGTLRQATDEEEKSGLNELGEQISSDVPIVFMTGTYMKPLSVFEIPDENVAIWEYQDIQEGKNIVNNEEYFKTNFPGIYEEALAKCFAYGETLESIQKMYEKFPNLYLLSTQFTSDAKDSFLKQSEGGEKVGFSTVTHLFQVKKKFSPSETSPTLWYTGFTNPKGISRLINYLSPTSEIVKIGEESIDQISSVMKRIDRISQRIGDRLAFFTKEFIVHSQLWFLPTMQGHPLIKRMSALAGVIFQSSWYRKNFNILAVSSSADWNKIPGAKDKRININDGIFTWACPNSTDTLKSCILREEANARAEGKGLVILAQNMLHLGISLTCVDIVVLLDAGEKVDERIQKMYRALTESTNKKGGFIVDLNYFRTVTAIMNYQIQTSKTRQKKNVYADSGLKEAFNNIIETYSIDDDLDIYTTKEEGGSSRISSETIPELARMLQKKATERGNSITISEVGRALNQNIEATLKDDYYSGINTLLGDLVKDIEKKQMRTEGKGIEKAQQEDDESEKPLHKIQKLFPEEIEANPAKKKDAFIDIFKTTLKIGVFGTSYKTIPELIQGLQEDSELRDIVFDTLVKRGAVQENADPEIVHELILRQLEKVSHKKGESYIGMKEAFNSKDTKSSKFQEVLNYINDHLAPKDKERHKYGEVFTPLALVDEMLSKLPQEGDDNVWNKKDFKWLDPANGIGNFPIKAFLGQIDGVYDEGSYKGQKHFTYPGLFEGLRKEIPDDTERSKWIIENMLYMVDINGKNNLVARKLFDKICPGAKSNIEQIDKKNGFITEKPLKFNNKEVKEFHIIMGNPPYNKGAVRVAMVTTKTRKERKDLGIEDDKAESGFWFKFVEKALVKGLLKPNGYLLFIHPITWFKPDRVGAHELMLSKQILNMRIYTDAMSKKLFGGKGEITVAYYLIENKQPTIKTKIINMNDGNEEVKLSKSSIIIKQGNSIFQKIQEKAKLFGNGDGLKHIQIKQCNDSGQYKLITILEDSGEIKYIRSSVAHPDQHTPKVIIGGIPKPIVLYDKEGEYGLYTKGQRHYFVGEDLDKINDYFKTKLSTFILKFVKFEQKFIKPSYYPDVRTLKLNKINDETLADYFGFTDHERREIDQMPQPIHPKEDKIIKISCSELKKEKEPAAEGGANSNRYNKTRKALR